MAIHNEERGKSPIFLADRARDKRQWERACRYYQEALGRNPDKPAIWVQYGHALKESGNLLEAESAYRRSLALDPGVADTHLQLGHALKIQGKKDEAAASYLHALALDPRLHYASLELLGLGWSLAGLNEWTMTRVSRALQRENGLLADEVNTEQSDLAFSVVFDISDLIDYFGSNRLPTGIQRVQMNIIEGLLRKKDRNFRIVVSCMTRHTDFWLRVPEALFLELCELAVAGGRMDDISWRAILAELDLCLGIGKPISFPQGAVLVNIGSSWWLPNYLLMVKEAKLRYGIRYVPFVHDLIPVITPEYCVKGLIQEFVPWLKGILSFADGYLVNSKATAKDLEKIAEFLGHPIPEPHVIRLDGEFSTIRERSNGGNSIMRHRSVREPFVLFVGTIEARKNHLLAFDVWLRMIRKRGLEKTPMLVCVGKGGWLAEAAMARLKASELLQRRVLILSTVADDELLDLYQRCLFTIFPSAYEGWGLPVTEALCHGKIPLITAVASLPEAGGELAEYFDYLSERNMLEKLELLIDDEGYRTAREAEIRRSFKPRSWEDIGDEIVRCALRTDKPATSSAVGGNALSNAALFPAAETRRYYALSRNSKTTLWPGMPLGEMYRIGAAWCAPEHWGVWLKPGIAIIAFTLTTANKGPHQLYLGLIGNPIKETRYRLQIALSNIIETGILQRDQAHWVMISIDPEIVQRGTIQVELEAQGGVNLREINTNDKRIVTLGMIGFYICAEDDLRARQSFVEAIQLNQLDRLSRNGCASTIEIW